MKSSFHENSFYSKTRGHVGRFPSLHRVSFVRSSSYAVDDHERSIRSWHASTFWACISLFDAFINLTSFHVFLRRLQRSAHCLYLRSEYQQYFGEIENGLFVNEREVIHVCWVCLDGSVCPWKLFNTSVVDAINQLLIPLLQK